MNEWFFQVLYLIHVNRPLFEIKDYRKCMKNQEASYPFITFGRGPAWIHEIKKKKGGKLSKFRRNTGLKMIGFPWQLLIRFKGLSISCRSRSCVWVTFSSLLGQHQIFVLKYVVLLWSVHWRFKRRESYRRDIGRVLFSFTFSWTETKSRFNFWVSACLNT